MLVSEYLDARTSKKKILILFIDIVHGDIKPQNILIFSDVTCKRTAKLSDFGASSFIPFSEQDYLLYMSKSVPWSAPEHHHRGFSFNKAVKMEIYSFGLFALGVLLENANGPDISLFQEEGADCDPRATAELAQRVFSTQVPRDSTLGASLGQLFALSLAYNPDQRAGSMDEIIRALEPQW